MCYYTIIYFYFLFSWKVLYVVCNHFSARNLIFVLNGPMNWCRRLGDIGTVLLYNNVLQRVAYIERKGVGNNTY